MFFPTNRVLRPSNCGIALGVYVNTNRDVPGLWDFQSGYSLFYSLEIVLWGRDKYALYRLSEEALKM